MSDFPRTAQDYTRALRGLMPVGAVWPDDPDTAQTQVLGPFAASWRQVEIDGRALLVDAFPSTAVNLLPEWETSLGLPDPCAGPAPTLQQRQSQVQARFSNTGGQSPSFFTQYAADLGYTITITQYAPWRMGVARCGEPIDGVAYAYAWRVNAPADTPDYGRAVLQCELTALSPVHSAVMFAYE